MTNIDSFQTASRRFATNTAKANGLNKEVVFAALSAAGMTKVVIGFDGESDSGQIDGVSAFSDETSVAFPDTKLVFLRIRYGHDEPYTQLMALSEAVERLCYGYLEQEHSGWEINEGAFGEFTFDVKERRITLAFSARFSDCHDSNHVF